MAADQAAAPVASARAAGHGLPGTHPERAKHAVWHRLRRHPGAIAGAAVFTAVALAVLFGCLRARRRSALLSTTAPRTRACRSPTRSAPTNLGRDTFARLLAGGRLSLAVGVAAMALSLTVGTVIGGAVRLLPPPRRPADAFHRPVPGIAGACRC